MKRLSILVLLFLSSFGIKAQFHFTSTITTSTSNEFLQIPAFLLEGIANAGIGTLTGDKLLFAPQLIFPVSIANDAPNSFGTMRGGYARAFSAPWKHLGDYGIGISGAWDHYDKPIGFYIGLNYKSREVAFKDVDLNDRAHYIAPEAGLRFMFGYEKGLYLEVGASYDYVVKYKGEMNDYGKDAVNNGVSLNFGIGSWNARGPFQLNFKVPIYNFYNKDFTPDDGVTYPFKGVNRNIAYISFISRLYTEF